MYHTHINTHRSSMLCTIEWCLYGVIYIIMVKQLSIAVQLLCWNPLLTSCGCSNSRKPMGRAVLWQSCIINLQAHQRPVLYDCSFLPDSGSRPCFSIWSSFTFTFNPVHSRHVQPCDCIHCCTLNNHQYHSKWSMMKISVQLLTLPSYSNVVRFLLRQS